MEKTIVHLYECLQKLIGLHRQLLDAARLEREALRDANLPAIQEMTYKKEGLIESVRQTEAQRMRCVAELALDWKKSLRDLTLSQIIIQVQGTDLEMAEKLRSSLATLTFMVEKVLSQNSDNRGLLEKSLSHVQTMKQNVLGEASPHAATYNTQGQRSSPTGGARLISKEV